MVKAFHLLASIGHLLGCLKTLFGSIPQLASYNCFSFAFLADQVTPNLTIFVKIFFVARQLPGHYNFDNFEFKAGIIVI